MAANLIRPLGPGNPAEKFADSAKHRIVIEPVGIFPAKCFVRLPMNAQMRIMRQRPQGLLLALPLRFRCRCLTGTGVVRFQVFG